MSAWGRRDPCMMGYDPNEEADYRAADVGRVGLIGEMGRNKMWNYC